MGDQVNAHCDYFLSLCHFDGRYRPAWINLFVVSVTLTVDMDYFFSSMNRIDRGYGPYFPVGGSTVDIEIDRIFTQVDRRSMSISNVGGSTIDVNINRRWIDS